MNFHWMCRRRRRWKNCRSEQENQFPMQRINILDFMNRFEWICSSFFCNLSNVRSIFIWSSTEKLIRPREIKFPVFIVCRNNRITYFFFLAVEFQTRDLYGVVYISVEMQRIWSERTSNDKEEWERNERSATRTKKKRLIKEWKKGKMQMFWSFLFHPRPCCQ